MNNNFDHFQLDEFVKLSSHTNLSLLDIRDNPCCRLNHLESFVVFHLRSLNTINGKVICPEMRNAAIQRFSKGRFIMQFIINFFLLKLEILMKRMLLNQFHSILFCELCLCSLKNLIDVFNPL